MRVRFKDPRHSFAWRNECFGCYDLAVFAVDSPLGLKIYCTHHWKDDGTFPDEWVELNVNLFR